MPLNIRERFSSNVSFEAQGNGGAWQNASFSEFNNILDPMVSVRNAGSTGNDDAAGNDSTADGEDVSEDGASEAVPEESDQVGGGEGVEDGSDDDAGGTGQGIGNDLSDVDQMVHDGKVAFQRDKRGEGDDVEKGVLQAAVNELYENDPEFKKAFDEALKNGLRVLFRFNADENSATVINNGILLVDVKGDADIKAQLRRRFYDESYKATEPGEGLTVEEVMADEDMSPADYVGHMERLGIFSFSGENGGKLRKEVIYILEEGPVMRKMIEKGIEKHIEDYGEARKYNFSTIGEGGGSSTDPFDDLGSTVNAGGSYEDGSTEDYDPAAHGNYRVLAHEMMHTFLSIRDRPVIDVTGELFAREVYGEDRTYSDAAHITYDDELKGTPWALDDDFDVDAFLDAAVDGELGDLSHQEIFDRFGGASVGVAPEIADDDDYDDKLNALVEAVRSSVDVDGRKTSHIDGDLADQYSQLLDYNMSSGDFDNWREAGEYTKKSFMARLGNFGPEAAVFGDYLESDGGNEQLDDLAFVAWNKIMNPGYDAIGSAGEADDVLNTIVSTIQTTMDVDARKTLHMEGELADDYKRLLEYNLRHGDFEDFEDLSEFTRDQFMDRLGNFPDEADVFEGYLERHGGNETLDSLAETVWNDFYVAPVPDEDAPLYGDGLWPFR